jgi:hypothetical protein
MMRAACEPGKRGGDLVDGQIDQLVIRPCDDRRGPLDTSERCDAWPPKTSLLSKTTETSCREGQRTDGRDDLIEPKVDGHDRQRVSAARGLNDRYEAGVASINVSAARTTARRRRRLAR